MQHPFRVVIVGGGITGLSAAHSLRRLRPDARITLFEASHRIGGTVCTVREHGFVVEGGPDSFLASKPAALELCRALGIAGELISTNQARRGSYVLFDGHLHPIPEGLTGLVPSRLDPLLASDLFTPAGKQRLAEEPDIPAREDTSDESLAAFVSRRFGPEVYERLIEPLMAGIYAGDGTQLSVLATFPQLRALEREHGSLLRGITARPAPSGPVGFLTPRSGMQAIIDALVPRLSDVRVVTGTPVRRVERQAAGFRVHTDTSVEAADAVVVTVPAYRAAAILAPADPAFGAVLDQIPYASSATLSLAYRETDVRHNLHGFGYVVPRVTGSPILASTWSSSKFDHRAPPGWALIRVFLGRYGLDILERDDAELLALARKEVGERLGVQVPPAHSWLFRWPRGMPQYTEGHLERLQQLDRVMAANPGIRLAGNLRGVGIPDCIRSGEEAARQVSAR